MRLAQCLVLTGFISFLYACHIIIGYMHIPGLHYDPLFRCIYLTLNLLETQPTGDLMKILYMACFWTYTCYV